MFVLWMFSHHGKVRIFALSGIPYFYDLGKPRTRGVPKQILWDTRAELFINHKSGTNGIPEYI
jgi:hypothetical protein